MNLQIELLAEYCKPEITDEANGGIDLRCREVTQVPPLGMTRVPLGIKTSFPINYVGLLFDRSGIAANTGLFKTAGVIDSNYRGEWSVVLHNPTRFAKTFLPGDRCCQVVFVERPRVQIDVVEKLDESDRGGRGFGSSGVE
jgi:dUTP pyrophosphatase